MNTELKLPGAAIVKSADRTIDLLEYLAQMPEPPTFGQIASELRIPKSSLSQLLANLVARGYVSLDHDKSVYALGDRVEQLARRALSNVPFEQFLLRAMERLREQVNETVTFYIRQGDDAEVIAVVA